MLPETRTRDNELIFDFERYLAMLKLVEDEKEQAGEKETHPVEHPTRGYIEDLLALFDGVRPDDYATSRTAARGVAGIGSSACT